MASASGPQTLYCSECGRPCAPDDLARFGDTLVCPWCKDSYAQKLREGVTVAPCVEYGGFWIRFVAVLIDGIILTVIGSILQFAILGSFIGIRPQPGMTPEAALGQLLGMVGTAWLLHTAAACVYEAVFVAQLA